MVILDIREPSIPQAPVVPAQISGFKLVGDNIDFGIKARYMRSNQYSNHSRHYFHSFAVQNRIDLSDYSDTYPHSCLDQPKRRAESLLPSSADDAAILNNIATLVSRVLAEHMPFFKQTFEDVTNWHIKHKYYEEMSSKSVVVRIVK